MLSRWVTGLVLISLGVLLVWFGSYPFWLWIMMVSLLAVYEVLGFIALSPIWRLCGLCIVALSLLTVQVNPVPIWSHGFMPSIMGVVIAVILVELWRRTLFLHQHPILQWCRVVLLFSLICPYFILLRSMPDGRLWMFFIMFSLAFCDTFALFGGRYFGRTKLSVISPKKTVEGSFFGVFGSILVGVMIALLFDQSLWMLLQLSILCAVLAQLGDLHESLTKRVFGVKDSSSILPGHGGVYDRLDSYLLVMPIFFYILNV